MTKRYDGGPAFPNSTEDGMLLRDYFAAKALSGLLVQLADWRSVGGEPEQVAGWAYELADAMLKERAK